VRNHALEINVQSDDTALCWICSPAYGEAPLLTRNPVQVLTLNDGEHRVNVAVTGKKLSIEVVKRLARQAVERDFDVRA